MLREEVLQPEILIHWILEKELAGRADAVLWPPCSDAIPDDEFIFRTVYLGLQRAPLPPEAQFSLIQDLYLSWGRTRRQLRNSLAFAVPGEKEALGALAQAREVFEHHPNQARLLIESGQGIGGWAEPLISAVADLYPSIWLPSFREGEWESAHFEQLPVQRSEDESLVRAVERAIEPKLNSRLAPEGLIAATGLGEVDCSGVRRVLFPLREAARWFFCFLHLPRFRDVEPIRVAVAKGVGEGKFGLLQSDRLLRLDLLPPEMRDQVIISRNVSPEEIRIDSGLYLVHSPKAPIP